METKQMHPMVAQMNAEVDNDMASAKSLAPPVELGPVLSLPEGVDVPKEKDVQFTSEDDYLPYLADINDNYDLQEQAFQTHRDGAQLPPNTISNQFLKPLKKTVMGIDVATGERVLNRGDFNNEESARHYRQGADKFRSASLNINEGYDVSGVSGAAHMAAGVISEGKTKKEYLRSIDMMDVPQWQANSAWNAAVSNKASNNINTAFSQPYSDGEVSEAVQDTPPVDMSRAELTQDSGWQDATKAIYQAEEQKAFEGSSDELMDWFVDEMTNFNWKVADYGQVIPGVNTSSMSYYALRAHSQGGEYAKNFLSMMDYYDRMETDWGTAGNALAALAGDPTSLVGLGGGFAANRVMGAVAKNRLKKWMQYTVAGAAAGTLEGAVYGGADSAMRQSVAVSAGEQEKIDMGQVAASAGAGAMIGQKVGGALGAALSPEARAMYRRGAQQMMTNARRSGSYTPLTRQVGSVGVRPNKYAVPPELAGSPTLDNASQMAKEGNFANNREFKVAMQEAMKGAARRMGINLNKDSEKANNILTGLMLKDAREALASNANAVGWYDQTVGAAMKVLELIHPEIATDPQARFAFTYALANTSNGLKVDKNFELAEAAYRAWKNTGQMPENIGIGNASGAINKTSKLFNNLADKVGIEAMDRLFDGVFTVKQMQLMGFDVSGELADTVVRGAAMMGPKIGNGFFSNLRGRFDQLTMDRWFVRTYGRLTANLIESRPDMVREKTASLKSFSERMKKDPAVVAAWKEIGVNLNERSMKKLGLQIQKSSMEPANREIMNGTGGEALDMKGKPSSVGQETRKTGNALSNYIDGQKEDPANGGERNRMRLILQNTLDELKQDYPDLTMSDLQAVLWYAEKRLYDKARTTSDVADGYVDDEAPDYANAAGKLAKSLGFTDEQVKGADANGRATGAGRVSGGDGGEVTQVNAGDAERTARKERRKYLEDNIYSDKRPRAKGDGKTSSFKRASRVSDREQRGIEATFEPKANYKGLLDSSEMASQTIYQLTPERSTDFHQSITSAKNSNEFGAAVYVYPEADYKDMKLFQSADGSGGFAIKPDGDIVSVYSGGNGGVFEMLQLAVEQGGTKLDAFDTVLPDIYETAGFIETSREPWNEKYAPEGWSKDTFAEFNNGEPDIVYMEYKP